jgi:hypothetical protein
VKINDALSFVKYVIKTHFLILDGAGTYPFRHVEKAVRHRTGVYGQRVEMTRINSGINLDPILEVGFEAAIW